MSKTHVGWGGGIRCFLKNTFLFLLKKMREILLEFHAFN
ncbi:hypothetical protein TREVI0001_0923 [Treponema vincentii ATCC 35580]|uniref:Uncharacterized protein n=1 Tax=Treponema vincentii ATCC 35580 TaxID=596324 RepID=C8PR53_9SPIR|nr:hypothetical protein TREVI0001_0923 [Treponema vincentii ATCC 35580]